jgi:hypothetical protein
MSNSPSHHPPIEALEQSKIEALEQSKSRLQADHAERSAERRARFAEDARIQDRAREVMFGQLRSKDVELKQLAEDRRRLIERRSKLVRRPLLTKGKPPIRRFSAFFGKVPPYDFTWTSASAPSYATATTDGDIELAVQSFGGEQSAAGGIGFWFSSDAAGNPGQRFSTSVNCSYDWWDTADLYVADNHGRTWLSVWGMSENGWVASSGDQFPSWGDHVGWYESHQDSRGASTSQEVFFNAQPNSLYCCWVNCSAAAYTDDGFLGGAMSSIHLHMALVAVYVE